MDDRPSLMRELAHELRDALSPIRAAIDLLRLRNFDTEVSRRVAEKVDRGLDCALAAVDAFVAADQCENGTLTVEVAPNSLDQILESARTALAPLFAGRSQRVEVARSTRAVEAMADAAKSLRVVSAMLEQASAVAPPRSAIEVRAAAGESGPEIRVRFPIETPDSVGESWFESYSARARGSRMALRTARHVMKLQRGSLDLALHSAGAGELVAAFAPVRPSRGRAARRRQRRRLHRDRPRAGTHPHSHRRGQHRGTEHLPRSPRCPRLHGVGSRQRGRSATHDGRGRTRCGVDRHPSAGDERLSARPDAEGAGALQHAAGDVERYDAR